MLDPFGGLSLGPIFGQRWAEEVSTAVAIYLLECGADAWEACRDLVAEVGHDGVYDVPDPVACIVQGLRDQGLARRGGPFAAQIDVLVNLLAPDRVVATAAPAESSSSSESSGLDSESDSGSDESDSDLEPGTP